VRGAAGYIAYRVLSGLFGLLPEPVIRRIGYGLGYLTSFVARGRFHMAMRHQGRVHGDGVDPTQAARRVFGYYGRYWAETFWLRPRRRRRLLGTSDIVDVQYLHDGVASGRGMILALPHVGNWEVAGLRAAHEGARVLAVAEALPNERLVRWVTDMRAMMDIDIVIARKGSRVTPALVERLEAGGTVALLSDRDLSGRGVGVVMFGEETSLPAGPVSLAVRTGADVVPVGTYFRHGAGHTYRMYPPLEIPDADTVEERVRLGTQRLAEVLEDIIRRAPEQWHLLQPNWPSDRA
jgi:KDO2-lipid IV(A) lauroyltransferase